MHILAVETSCDETSAAVINDGTEILSNIVASQTEFHKKYGGIVPEIASRKHIEAVSPVIKEAMERSGLAFKDIDAVAVTHGPGLPGSLLVGLSAAKAIAFALNKPLIGVNHLEGHIYANFLTANTEHGTQNTEHRKNKDISFPLICLIVSGGHTQIVLVKDHCEYETLGRTRDDAAGEAYDKVARFLGLGYPGGPIIDELAKKGNPDAIDFKRPMIEEEYKYDFSFSGIKTAVVYYVKKGQGTRERGLAESNVIPVHSPQPLVPDIAASFQRSVVSTLVEKTIRAAKDRGVKTVALAGGVSANSELRAALKAECDKNGFNCVIPPIEFCTDNAAMIGCAGYFRFKKGFISDHHLGINSTLRL